MTGYAVESPRIGTFSQQSRQANVIWGLFFVALLGISAALGLAMLEIGPKALFPGLLVGLACIAVVIWRPRYGVYGCVFLTVMGDGNLMPWYPFVKDLSSQESLLYINHSLIFSPLEACLVLTCLAWLGHAAVQRRLKLQTGRMLWPVLIFIGFVTLGLVYGVGRGGDLRIGLWESRAIFYIPIVLLLVNNLLTRREHLNALMWAIILSLFIEGLVGCYVYFAVLKTGLTLGDSITEHAAAVHFNVLFILVLAVWMYPASRVKRVILPVLALPVLLAYLADERRAAFVALMAALVMMAVVLFQYRPRVFWLVMPVMAVAAAAYLAVYWNNTGALGLPARAVKSIVTPQQTNARDQSSDQYRVLENINILFTIKQAPLTGVGFGQKFDILVPMPDISFFEWWQYLSHNSVLYIWMKTGVLGFWAMLIMAGWSIAAGANILKHAPAGDLSAFALTATLFIVMHFVFAYVDISWDPRSMLLIGTMLGMLTVIERLSGQSEHSFGTKRASEATLPVWPIV